MANSPGRPLTKEEIDKRLWNHYQGKFTYKPDYMNYRSHHKVGIFCNAHQIWFTTLWASHLTRGQPGCPECIQERKEKGYEAQRHTHEEFTKMVYEKWGNKVKLVTKYIGFRKPITVECHRHGTHSLNFAGDILYHVYPCIYCAIEDGAFSVGTSKTEDLIDKILKDYGFDPKRQVSFPGCVYKKPLLFDFWLPEINTAIEYDGEQHFDPDNYYNRHEGKFEDRQIKDGIKDDFCAANSIRLIRISHTVKDIAQYLADHLFT